MQNQAKTPTKFNKKQELWKKKKKKGDISPQPLSVLSVITAPASGEGSEDLV